MRPVIPADRMKLRRMSETLRSARPIDRQTKARVARLASHRGWHRNRLGAGTDGERRGVPSTVDRGRTVRRRQARLSQE